MAYDPYARCDPLDLCTEYVTWPQSIFVAVVAMLILYHLHATSTSSWFLVTAPECSAQSYAKRPAANMSKPRPINPVEEARALYRPERITTRCSS